MATTAVVMADNSIKIGERLTMHSDLPALYDLINQA